MEVRAAVVAGPGRAPTVETITVADLLPWEVHLRPAACGVCHTDVAWADGDLTPTFPVVLGHECAGVVESVGSAVTRVAPGDHVVVSLTHHCGRCEQCERASPMLCTARTSRPRLTLDGQHIEQGFGTGGFSEAVVVGESSAVPIPRELPLPVAALLGCAVATGLGAVATIARVEPGSRVAVFGAGGIGLCVVLGAVLAGAERVAVVDPDAERRRTATALGATDAVGTAEDLGDDLGDAFAGGGFDFVFEATGRPDVMATAYGAARRGGTVVLIGAPRPDARLDLPALAVAVSQRRLLGCLTGDLRPAVDLPRYARLYLAGRLDLDPLLTGSSPLDDVAAALDGCRQHRGIRTVVTP